jgi:hypothetical protein
LKKTRPVTAFTVGAVIGAVAMFGFKNAQQSAPVMSCSGRVQLDTASHEDLRLNNSVYMDNRDAPNGRMYLQFKDDQAMNNMLGKRVTVTGRLKSVELDSGDSITVMAVDIAEQLE